MPADWLGLGGRRVLIAGGAGTIGAGLVNGFVNAGATVGVTDVSDDALARVDGRVAARHAADLRDPQAARDAVAAVRDALGGLDVFVHCVGVNDRRPIEDYDAADWDRIVSINLTSAFHTAAEALTGMRAQASGRMVFFSSVAGRSGHKHHGPYAATKAAINQLTRVIAHENAEHGITANAVAPGYMDTELTRRYLAENPSVRVNTFAPGFMETEALLARPEWKAGRRDVVLSGTPAAKIPRPEEMTGAALFLASDDAHHITGTYMIADGGYSMLGA